MKKAGVLALIIILSLIIVTAQNATESIDEKAVSCLKNKVKDRCSSLTLEQQVFSLLSLSDDSSIQSECRSALLDNQSGDSFGSIKDTSLALIALNHIGTNTLDIEEYLLDNKQTASLEWFLEIESNSKTKCTVDSSSITIGEDKKISGTTGSCLSLAYSNYWLRISDNCLNNNFTISCDQDFISTLIYKKSGSNTWHVTSDVQSASSNGETEHQVKSFCFGSGTGGCDYESSLWGALALSRTGNSISEFLPYLITFSDDNKNLFPETFLYILTSSGEYLNKIASSQKSGGEWKQGNNEYYDTALALLSLFGYGSESISDAISWLETKQGNDGCWNNGNIRDTGILLWAAYPATPASVGGGSSQSNCQPDNYCTSLGECDEALGTTLDNFYCPGLKVCCDTQPIQKTCSELGGTECSGGQVCSSGTTSASDSNKCCLASCQSETSECESYGYSCRTSCLENEESDSLYDCNSGICCKSKAEDEGGFPWLIILLIILIILVILAIIFRKKLKIFLFKIKSKFKKGPVTKTRPRFPPTGPPQLRRMFPTRLPRRQPQRPIGRPRRPGRPRKASTKSDRELAETMRKLKEMSK